MTGVQTCALPIFEDVLEVGQKLQVEITKIDDRGKLSLSPVVEGQEGDSADAE